MDTCLKLKEFLDHSTKQCHYFYLVKKCGHLNCKTCLLPCLPWQTFQKLHDLLDPISDYHNEDHYKSFSYVFGKVTTEEHHPSGKLTKKKKKLDRIPFNPLKQHSMNTNLIIECTKCNKPHIVYAQKKISARCVQAFKRVTHDLLFVLI